MHKSFIINILLVVVSCNAQPTIKESAINQPEITTINKVSLPNGFVRQQTDSLSFGYYLQHLAFAKDNTVYYYDGTTKQNQSQHYKVINLPLTKTDIQQCADAIMRLRANYFFTKKQYQKIEFKSSTTTYNFGNWINQHDAGSPLHINTLYQKFLETVFINCGTYNLAAMLKPKQHATNIKVGDVFVKGGSPGHAMIVVDVAYNAKTQQTIFMLAQSFMPAQSMHVVVNEEDKNLSPWYVFDNTKNLVTPSYSFSYAHLKEW